MLLVVDQSMIRGGLKHLFELHSRYVVVGETADPVAGAELAARHDPDVVLVDLRLPENGGTAWMETLQRESRATIVKVLGTHAERGDVQRALEAGANAVLAQEGDPSELFLSIDAVVRGCHYVSPHLGVALLRPAARGGTDEEQDADLEVVLEPLELEVLRRLALGRNADEIARELDRERAEVLELCELVRGKTGVESSAEMMRLALRLGLFPML